jgi:hypothetical protein
MALSQSDLDALDPAIARGTLSVVFEGRKHVYQTTAALIQARDHVARVVAELRPAPLCLPLHDVEGD